MAWDDTPPDPSSWDAEPPKNNEITTPLSDVPMNALENVGRILNPANIIRSGAEQIKTSAFDLPKEATQTLAQVIGNTVAGKPIGQTPMAQRAADIASSEPVQNPVEWAKKNPVDAAMTMAAPITPFLGKGAVAEGLASKLGRGMEEKGGSLANDLGEISGSTVKKMNPRVLGAEAQGNIRKAGDISNIADVRSEIGKKLVKDDVVGGFGQDVGDRLQKVNELKDTYGKQVDSALEDIRKTNRSTGEYSDVDDALHVQATPILKGVLDTANELRDSARSGLRQTSRYWRETYNSLAKKAEDNNGRLNFDDIRTEMQDVGKDMNAGVNSPRYSTAKDIYGHLAELRDEMVDQIAQQSGNPKLASNLLNANKQYSFYSKIADGLQDAGAGGEVPEKMGKHMVRSTMRGDPMHATGYLGLMKLLNAVEPAMAQKLVRWGPGVSKYGGVLEAAAKQGAKNLAVVDHLLKQQDPEYAKAMQ